MAFLKKPFRLGLQARITALTIIGLAAMFVAIGFIGLRVQAASMDVVLEQRKVLAEMVSAHVEHHTSDLLAALAQSAAEPGFDLSDADPTPERAALADLFRSGMFTAVFVTDARGVVLAAQPKTLRADLVGADFSGHPYIRRALESGQPQVSGLISGVAVSGPLVSLVVPVKTANGETTGLIGGALDPGGPEISGFIGSMGFGETGYAQVVDGQGMVVASTVPGRAGTSGEHRDLILSLIQRGEATVSPNSPVTEAGKEFHEVIAFAPIPSLGWAITVEQDRDETLAPIIQARNQILLASAFTLALAVLFVWFTTRQVTKPVLALARAARQIATGDLATPITIAGSDEVAELGRNFEAMRRKLVAWGEELEAAVQIRTRQLSVLYAIDRVATQSLDLDEILNDALGRVLEVLEVEAGGIYLLEPDGERMTLRVHRGHSDEFVGNVRRIRLGEGVSGRAAAERQAVVLNASDYPTERLAAFIVREGIQNFASMPLLSGGKLVGVLNLATHRQRTFLPEEMELLTSIGQQLGGAVANAQLHQLLRVSEQEYRTLVENATELIWTTDIEGRFTFVNRQAEVVSGQKLEDVIGKSFAPLIAPPEDLPLIQRVFLKTLAGAPQSYEVGVYRRDGSVFHLSVNTAPLYRDGEVAGTISFGRDVTAQHEAEAALTQRMAELSSLFEMSSALRGVEGLERMLPVIVDKAVEACRADCGSVLLLDESGEMLVYRYGTGARQILMGARRRLGQGISGRVAQSGAPHLSPDFQHDPLLIFEPATPTRLPEIASDVCVPLHVGEQVVGVMHVSAYTPRTFTEAEVRLLTAIANMAASAIHRAGLFEQLEHRVHELSVLFDVGKMVTASLRIEHVLKFVAGAATQAVHAEGSFVFLWDEQEERLVLHASQGFLAEGVGRVKYRLGEGLAGWVFLERQGVNAPDLAADPRWKREPEHEAPLPSGRAKSARVVPLIVGNKTLGVLGVVNKIGAPAPSTALRASFSVGDETLLTALAGQISIAIENARLYEDVRDLSVAAIRSLATAIDARDPYTRGHSDDVARLAVQMALAFGWGGADLEMIEFAALLHDVGKIAVPDAVLKKAEPLTADEWTIIRLHPYHSAQIVKPVESLRRIVPWVYHHQEHWDGTGYPDGLKGEAIPLASRIIAVADAFNAMTTDRPYRKALAVTEVLAEIRRCAGKQFDPQVAAVFLQMMKQA
jgi:PAS domain S-box-containing protein